MTSLKLAVVSGVAALAFALAPVGQKAEAQVSFGINIGAAPVCPYGYYGYAPYNCAPYGFYGPEWFNDGVFIGSGPWYHGRAGFHGEVNHNFDARDGYHGSYPAHGKSEFHGYSSGQFHGNEQRDTHGNVVGGHHH